MTNLRLTGMTLILLAASAPPALAASRDDCRRACGARVSACLVATTQFGPVGKLCEKTVWRQCVRSGIQSCQATTTTTPISTTSTTILDAGDVNLIATGQTTCFDTTGVAIPCAGTGQDGELRTGLTHSYIDNGNGTITDLQTGLMWEKLSDDGGIHDKDTWYSPWDSAFGAKVDVLNALGFAGYTDWRLPNRTELESLVDLGSWSPAVLPPFDNGACSGTSVPSNTGCTVLECSCTADGFYWTSSSSQGDPTSAWGVAFYDGYVGVNYKANGAYVRAVRSVADCKNCS